MREIKRKKKEKKIIIIINKNFKKIWGLRNHFKK